MSKRDDDELNRGRPRSGGDPRADFTSWDESLSWQRGDEDTREAAGAQPAQTLPRGQEKKGAAARRRPRLLWGGPQPPGSSPAAQEQQPGSSSPPAGRHRRRRASAGATLLAMLLGFFFAGLLDAGAIRKEIEARPLGTLRSVQLALLGPMVSLSGALSFDAPGSAINHALGRDRQVHHSLDEVAPKAQDHWPRAITRQKPLRLLIVGDSMAQSLGPDVKNTAERMKTVKARVSYKVSSGLSRPDFFDWPQYMIDLIVDFDPDATVVVLGDNDAQDFKSNGKVVYLGSPAWKKAYRSRAARAMKTLTRNGRRVYWIGAPPMRHQALSDAMAMINGLYEAEAAKHPGVQYVSTWELLAGPNGGYAEYLNDEQGRPTLMRMSDGEHLTMAGAALVTRYILDIVKRDWSMGALPGAAPSPSGSPSR